MATETATSTQRFITDSEQTRPDPMAQPTRETTEADSSTTDTKAGPPEWVAAEPYDPDADLRERVRQLVEMESDVDVCGKDERGFYRVLGQPQEVKEVESGAIELSVGPSQFNCQYEVVVPKPENGAPFVRSVDRDQDYESYIDGRETVLQNADIRIYNVDEDRFTVESQEVPA